jgi:GTP-binding protein Era
VKAGFVAIIGRPNVGKSTLLNAIVGEKIAITADKPQTTRNRIRGIYNDEECQIVFTDTPGVTTPKNKLGEYMAGAALGALPDADAVLFITDSYGLPSLGGDAAGSGDFISQTPEGNATGSSDFILHTHEEDAADNGDFIPQTQGRDATDGGDFILKKLQGVNVPKVLVINKTDLMPPDKFKRAYEAWEAAGIFTDIIGTTATDGVNVKEVVAALKKHLPEGVGYFPDDMATDRPERFIVSEIIREKALHYLRDEVPHGVAVGIEKYEEGQGVTRISAVIYAEKKSHKGIIIGKSGRKLKGIGKSAREDIEELLGTKVFLELWVKIKPGWRDSDFMLGSLGYKD